MSKRVHRRNKTHGIQRCWSCEKQIYGTLISRKAHFESCRAKQGSTFKNIPTVRGEK